jgi:antitoxin component HigA of HigAB toxin-antitoxin module
MSQTAQPGTTEGDRLEVLVTLIEAWERRDFSTVSPHAGDASDAR